MIVWGNELTGCLGVVILGVCWFVCSCIDSRSICQSDKAQSRKNHRFQTHPDQFTQLWKRKQSDLQTHQDKSSGIYSSSWRPGYMPIHTFRQLILSCNESTDRLSVGTFDIDIIQVQMFHSLVRIATLIRSWQAIRARMFGIGFLRAFLMRLFAGLTIISSCHYKGSFDSDSDKRSDMGNLFDRLCSLE